MNRITSKDAVEDSYSIKEVIDKLGELEAMFFLMKKDLEPEECNADASIDVPERLNRRQILEKAIHTTSGRRVQDYGTPERSFEVIAQLWEPFVREKCMTKTGELKIKAEDVAAMMALFKLARVATGHDKADNFIDCCGYAACAGELQSGGIPDGVDNV